jgi:hypothetical protein
MCCSPKYTFFSGFGLPELRPGSPAESAAQMLDAGKVMPRANAMLSFNNNDLL